MNERYAKRRIQVALALIASFHLGVLGVFVGAPTNVLVGFFLLFLFWGAYGLCLFIEH